MIFAYLTCKCLIRCGGTSAKVSIHFYFPKTCTSIAGVPTQTYLQVTHPARCGTYTYESKSSLLVLCMQSRLFPISSLLFLPLLRVSSTCILELLVLRVTIAVCLVGFYHNLLCNCDFYDCLKNLQHVFASVLCPVSHNLWVFPVGEYLCAWQKPVYVRNWWLLLSIKFSGTCHSFISLGIWFIIKPYQSCRMMPIHIQKRCFLGVFWLFWLTHPWPEMFRRVFNRDRSSERVNYMQLSSTEITSPEQRADCMREQDQQWAAGIDPPSKAFRKTEQDGV